MKQYNDCGPNSLVFGPNALVFGPNSPVFGPIPNALVLGYHWSLGLNLWSLGLMHWSLGHIWQPAGSLVTGLWDT